MPPHTSPPLLSTSAKAAGAGRAQSCRTVCRRSCGASRKRLAPDANILSTLAPSSFAGICLTLLPWLLCGGTLVLHHPFDPAFSPRQARTHRCDTLVLPAPGRFRSRREPGVRRRRAVVDHRGVAIAGAARGRARPGAQPDIALVDVAIFGEAALAPARRGGGKPKPMPAGSVTVPREATGGIVVAELTRTEAGTLALRGPMVPQHSFPPGIERSGLPYFKIGPRRIGRQRLHLPD